MKSLVDKHYKDQLTSAEGKIKSLEQRNKELHKAIERQKMLWASEYTALKIQKRKPSTGKYFLRVLFGDTHGCHIDNDAWGAFLNDLEIFGSEVEEWVHGGDIRDCAGTYSRFKKIHLREFSYTIQDDTKAANDQLDQVQARTPNTRRRIVIEGNHDYRVDFWAIETFKNAIDAKMVIGMLGTQAVLHLDQRGVEYIASHDCHGGLNKPGMIQLGKCKILHGSFNSLHATYQQVTEVKDNVVHFHNHRNTSIVIRTADKDAVIGSGVGCLCVLQPYYFHYHLATHTHGYLLQVVNRESGEFHAVQVPIVQGRSMMSQFKDSLVRV